MPTKSLISFTCLGLAVLAAGAGRLAADYVDTKSGAHLVGKVTAIAAGAVTLSTDYAGDIVIKQSEVTAIVTDHPVSVRLASGTRVEGTLSTAPAGGPSSAPAEGTASPPPEPGTVHIAGTDGTQASAPIANLAALWPAGGVDPEIAALQHHWAYEASTNINGTTGNKNALDTELGFKATLTTPQDTLQFYTDYNRQVTEGQLSTDQFKAGVDYAANYTERSSWYVKDEAGFDRIQDIDFYDVAAAGEGYDIVKTTPEILTARVGLSYRYDGYSVSTTPTVSSTGLDAELDHEYHWADSVLENKLTYDPAFQDFGNYLFTHVSSYTIPIKEPNWKLKIGVENDYNSKPPPGVTRLDTTYFTQLILDWQ